MIWNQSSIQFSSSIQSELSGADMVIDYSLDP